MPKRIDKLTKEQEAQMGPWAKKWIAIGLSTGKSNKKATEKAIKVCYEAAKLDSAIPIVWCPSPMAGALAASIARSVIDNQKKESDSAVGSAVYSAVNSAVYSEVNSAVYLEVRSAVDSAVRSAEKIQWHDWFGGSLWTEWPSYIDFFVDACDLTLDNNIAKLWNAYRTITLNCSYWIPNKHFCIVCEKPRRLHLQNGKLHNMNGMAIEFADGWGLHALDGKVFDSHHAMHKEILGVKPEIIHA